MYGVLIDKGSTKLGGKSGLYIGTKREHHSRPMPHTPKFDPKDGQVGPKERHPGEQVYRPVSLSGCDGIEIGGATLRLRQQASLRSWSRHKSISITSSQRWATASDASLIYMAAPEQAFSK